MQVVNAQILLHLAGEMINIAAINGTRVRLDGGKFLTEKIPLRSVRALYLKPFEVSVTVTVTSGTTDPDGSSTVQDAK